MLKMPLLSTSIVSSVTATPRHLNIKPNLSKCFSHASFQSEHQRNISQINLFNSPNTAICINLRTPVKYGPRLRKVIKD